MDLLVSTGRLDLPLVTNYVQKQVAYHISLNPRFLNLHELDVDIGNILLLYTRKRKYKSYLDML